MADSILRLKVESQEYDNKLKQAAQGLTRYADECRKVGGTLEVVEKETLDYVKAIGQMETHSRTATGKLAEMKKAFVEFSSVYKDMTDAEKQSPVGKALAESLDQLKGRIEESKKNLADINKELGETSTDSKGASSAIEALTSQFGISTKALAGWGAALAAGEVALNTVKGAIESTEATHDALARAMAVTDNITNQFLRTLATADFSTFTNGLQGIIDKTIDAYNAMDEFESYAARFQPWQTAQEGTINTKLQEARAAKAQGDIEKAERLTNEAKALIDQLAASTKAYGEKQTTGGFATIRSLMGGVDITDKQIAWYADPKNWEKAKQKAEEYKRVQEEIDGLSRSSISASSYDQKTRSDNQKRINQLKAKLAADPSLKRAYTMLNLRDSGDSEEAAALKQALGNIYGNTMAETRIASIRARADRMDGVITRAGSGGRGGTTTTKELDPLQQVQKQIADLSKEALTADDARLEEITKQVSALQEQERTYKQIQDRVRSIYDINAEIEKQYPQRDVSGQQAGQQLSFMDQARQDYALQLSAKNIEIDETTFNSALQVALQNGLDGLDVDFTTIKEKMAEGMDIPDETWEELQNTINEKLAELDIDPIEINFKTGNVKDQAKEMAKEWQSAGSAIQAVGSAMQAIEDPAAKVLGTIAQAIATMALSYAQASLQAAKNPANAGWGWIAFAATGVATMLSSIAAIKSATAGSYEQGGIVPGNSWTGDHLTAQVNSGELILNRSQQNTIAAQLTGGNQQAQGGMVSTPYVDGERIFLGQNNYLKRAGKGEIVTTSMLRRMGLM